MLSFRYGCENPACIFVHHTYCQEPTMQCLSPILSPADVEWAPSPCSDTPTQVPCLPAPCVLGSRGTGMWAGHCATHQGAIMWHSRANDIQGLGETHSGVLQRKVTWPGVFGDKVLGGGCSGWRAQYIQGHFFIKGYCKLGADVFWLLLTPWMFLSDCIATVDMNDIHMWWTLWACPKLLAIVQAHDLELIQCHWENGHGRPWSLCPYGLVHMGGQGTQPQPGLTPYVNIPCSPGPWLWPNITQPIPHLTLQTLITFTQASTQNGSRWTPIHNPINYQASPQYGGQHGIARWQCWRTLHGTPGMNTSHSRVTYSLVPSTQWTSTNVWAWPVPLFCSISSPRQPSIMSSLPFSSALVRVP